MNGSRQRSPSYQSARLTHAQNENPRQSGQPSYEPFERHGKKIMRQFGKKCLLMLAAWLILSGSLHLGYAQESLVFSRYEGITMEISEQVLKEAYQRIGIQIRTEIFPAERAIVTSNNGDTDGELTRIAGIEKSYPNLMMVPVVVNENEAVVFVKQVTFEVKGWESLKPYTIGIRQGMKFAEQGTQGMKVEPVPTYAQCFKMLDAGQIDAVVATRVDGLETIKSLKLTGITILEPPLTSFKLYHYLHKKHAELIPKITKALQEMETEGRIHAIREQAIAKLLAP